MGEERKKNQVKMETYVQFRSEGNEEGKKEVRDERGQTGQKALCNISGQC